MLGPPSLCIGRGYARISGQNLCSRIAGAIRCLVEILLLPEQIAAVPPVTHIRRVLVRARWRSTVQFDIRIH